MKETNIEKRTLRDVDVGQTAIVKRLKGPGPLKQHLMNMGITKGSEIFVKKLAPLGDPVEITIRGYQLSLRKTECELIEVE